MAARRGARAVLVAALLTGSPALAAGCERGTVELGFDPAVGDVATYRIEIEASVLRELSGESPDERKTSDVLTARQEVIEVGEDDVLLRVDLAREGGAPRRSTVRLDRAGLLTGVEAVEGLPGEVLGIVGLDELLPSAAAPGRAVGPGESWPVRGEVALAEGAEPAALQGHARLDRLGVIDGEEVAVITTSVEVPLRLARDVDGASTTIEGSQRSRSTVMSELAGGAVRSASTSIRGDAAVTIAPPARVAADPAEGRIVYRLDVRVERVD